MPRALSWLRSLEKLAAASLLATTEGTACHQPSASCQVLVAEKTDSSKEGRVSLEYACQELLSATSPAALLCQPDSKEPSPNLNLQMQLFSS